MKISDAQSIFRTREWDTDAGLGGLKSSALGFQLLRLNGYQVSTDVFKVYLNEEDEGGQLFGLSTETYEGFLTTLDLYKCSQLAFPWESDLMDLLATFTEARLQQALLQNGPLGMCQSLLDSPEFLPLGNNRIEFALTHPRKWLLPMLRLESRSLVRHLWPAHKAIEIYMELAMLEMNILQKLYLKEIKHLNRWWVDSGFNKFEFARNWVVKTHFTIVAGLCGPEFAEACAAFTKMACISAMHDGIFDLPTSKLEDLHLYFHAVERFSNSVNEIETYCNLKANKSKEFFQSLHSVNLISSHVKDAEWRQSVYIPTFDEYTKVGAITVSAEAGIMGTIFFIGEQVSDEALKFIGPHSRLLYLSGRLSLPAPQ
ncbi:bifunctional levopimaradiene synthase, chloroplastic [Amborella trichopoda]|uniref:bifunctional levopimaradiene synthase, chloroplastic n=1 Tax=Amborella trichopoda TaxID=13333 RepID=UPI0005D2E385|nr:bifunctional levopimaradiene synthase, chloroplastic [Amborella trichopoda]|eukprot:XP_011623906.1 bifunctional levopimaradiene synthase, chloroplastic [Amborella trichopoda]